MDNVFITSPDLMAEILEEAGKSRKKS